MNAVDEYIPTPERDIDKPFLMPVEDVSRSPVVEPLSPVVLSAASSRSTEEIEIVGIREGSTKTTVTGIECSASLLSMRAGLAKTSDCFFVAKREDVERGQVIVKPGTTTPHRFPKLRNHPEQGPADATPVLQQLPPQFYFRTTDVTGVVTPARGHRKMVMPGDNTEMTVALIQPVAMEDGLKFCNP